MKLNDLYKTICPIFRRHIGEAPEHFASGVLLQIADDVFLLTSAHVSDVQDEYQLLVPGEDFLIPVRGYFAHIPVADGSSRSEDTIDIAYYRLLPEVVKNLHSGVKVLTRKDVLMCDQLIQGDLYTFAGFPWRKTKVRGITYETDFYTYSGGACSHEAYAKLGYDPEVNVLIRFNRKKSFRLQNQTITTAPLPEGISGGGVFAWPKDMAKRNALPELKLVGIAHSFHEKDRCMAATRINTYLACILRNNPSVNVRTGTKRKSQVPLLTSMVWYKKDEWDQLKKAFVDGNLMHESWEEWRDAALSHMEAASQQGSTLFPMQISLAEIAEFCEKNGVPNTSKTRAELASRKTAQLYFASENPVPEHGDPSSS